MYIKNSYITENFDIEAERSTRDYNRYVGDIFFDLEQINIKEAAEKIKEELSRFPEEAFIVNDNYSYKGGPEWVVYVKEKIPETDREVIERLKEKVKEQKRVGKKNK